MFNTEVPKPFVPVIIVLVYVIRTLGPVGKPNFKFAYFDPDGNVIDQGKIVFNKKSVVWYLFGNSPRDNIVMTGIDLQNSGGQVDALKQSFFSISFTNYCKTRTTIGVRLDFQDNTNPDSPINFSSTDPQIINEPGETLLD